MTEYLSACKSWIPTFGICLIVILISWHSGSQRAILISLFTLGIVVGAFAQAHGKKDGPPE